MTQRRQDPRRKPVPAWHKVFLGMMPAIIRYAKVAFRNLDPEARQEAVQNVVTNSCAATAALARRGKLDLAYPTVLARFGIRQTRDHRITGNSLNIRDVLSKYCQANKGVKVERLDKFNEQEDAWEETVVEDKTSGPADIARTRIDFAAWLDSLKRRDRKIAEALAAGNRTSDVSKRFKVSAGRISQLRKELAASWRKFVGDEPDAAGATLAV
jgi:hypothetical protein